MKRLIIPTIATIALTILVTACHKDDDIYAPGNPDATPTSTLVKIKSISKSILEADTASLTIIEVAIHPETDSILRSVIFTTSLGNFPNGKTTDTVRANAYGIASNTLLSNTSGMAKISVKVKATIVDTSVTFIQALPDDMLMTADSYIGDSAASFTVRNPLFRNPNRGKVTDPVKVFYSVTPISPAVSGLIFPAFAFSSNRQAAINITNPLHLKGTYIVEAKVVSSVSNTDTIRRSINIKIQ